MRARATWATVLAGVVLVAAAAPAAADTEGHWATVEGWTFAPPASTATVAVPGSTGFPSASLTSSTSGPAGPASGESAWLGAWTPPGERYGSSRDQQYLSLRPAAGGAPSTSTYAFERPTPAGGWMLGLGDIDAEALTVTATDADGEPVPAADLGFRSGFNYCQGSPRPSTSTCDDAKSQPVPLWDPVTATVSGPSEDADGDPIPGATVTDGAAVWLEPAVPLSSITVTASRVSGSPVYQTWVAALSRDVTGTVGTADACEVAGLEVTLSDGSGAEVTSPTTDAEGGYGFDDVATYDDWTVSVAPPAGCRPVGEPAPTADLSADDAVVDVELEAITGTVTGTVLDELGDPVPGVEIEVEDGPSATAPSWSPCPRTGARSTWRSSCARPTRATRTTPTTTSTWNRAATRATGPTVAAWTPSQGRCRPPAVRGSVCRPSALS